MIRSSFFWRLYLALALLAGSTAAGIGFVATRQLEHDFSAQIATRLRTQAAALLPLADRAFSRAEDLQDTVVEVARETGARITLVTPDGRVLADSYEDPAVMDNHAGRPELAAAFAQGEGTSRRFSDTTRREMLYFARRVEVAGTTMGAVRVALPLSEIDAQLTPLRLQIVAGAVVAMIAALAIGGFIAGRISTPIAEMTAVSEALRQGDYDSRVRRKGVGEIRTLGDNLNRMADELSKRIDSLASQRAQLDAIIRSMQEGVLAVDANGGVVVSNAVGRELLGLDEVDPSRIGAVELASVPAIVDLIETARRQGAAAHGEIVLQAGDVVLDARATPFAGERAEGVVVVLYNISELRRLERVRTDFVANVSHEIKTPLTSIQGYVETLLDGAVNDSQNNVRFLEKIQSHVRRLSALVADLLSLARIESPGTSMCSEVVDWREVVVASMAQHRDRIARQRLRLDLELGDAPMEVVGDRESMRQIVDNLLDNAIAYTPQGGSLEIRLDRSPSAGTLRVTDTGIGIPEADLDRIFERFYRVDRGRSRDFGGTGLGLSIVRNLVQRMGGTVKVESRVGEGSAFMVSLPLGESVPSLS